MKLRPLVLIAFSVLLACPPLWADDYDGFLEGNLKTGRVYIAGTAGLFANYDVEDGDALGGGDFEYDLGDGAQAAGAVGMYFGNTRVEFEVGYWQAELTQIQPFPLDNDAGDFEYLTFMFNVYSDLPLGSDAFELYIGGGAGVARVDAGFIFSPPFTLPDATTISSLDDEQYTFTAQALVGFAYNITPNLAVTAGYRARYIAATRFDTGQNLRSDIVHSADVGLRISF